MIYICILGNETCMRYTWKTVGWHTTHIETVRCSSVRGYICEGGDDTQIKTVR